MRLFLPATLALALPGFADAACPTAADLETTGVYIDYSDGTYVRYARLEPEIVGETTHAPEGVENYFSARYRGAFLLLDATLAGDGPDPETLLNFQPEAGAPELPAPKADMDWGGAVVTRSADGEVVNKFRMRIRGAGQESLHISGCDYDAMILKVEEVYEDGDSALELRYLPALDIAFVSAAGALGEDFEHYYTPLSVGVKAPR